MFSNGQFTPSLRRDSTEKLSSIELRRRPRCELAITSVQQHIITVQHGSADMVVRAMNVKYRKWRLGGSCDSENLASVITSPTRPHMQNLVTIGSKEAWCACAKFAVRRLFFSLPRLPVRTLNRQTPLMAQTKRPEACLLYTSDAADE